MSCDSRLTMRTTTAALDVGGAGRVVVVGVARAPRGEVAAANDDAASASAADCHHVDNDVVDRDHRRPPESRTASSWHNDVRHYSGRSAFLRPMIVDNDEKENDGSRLRVRVRVDGSVVVASNDDRGVVLPLPGDDDGPRASHATCDKRLVPIITTSTSTSTSTSRCFADDRQVDAIARLSALRVTGEVVCRSAMTTSSYDDVPSPPPIVAAGGGTETAGTGGSWLLGLPFAFARTIGRGVGKAIDGVLSAYEGDEYGDFYPGTSMTTTTTTGGGGGRRSISDATGAERGGWEETDDDISSHSVRRMLAMDVAYTPKIDDLDDGDGGVRAAAAKIEVVDTSSSEEEEAFDLEAVASACRGLLSYTRLLLDMREGKTTGVVVVREGGDDDGRDFFAPRRDGGGGEGRMMLLLKDASGGDACSFGGLCRGAGRRRGAATTRADGNDIGGGFSENDDDENPARRLRRCDDEIIPPNLVEVDVDLLARTLVASGLARMEGDVITIYPGGVPDSERLCSRRSSDEALFRIHVTRIAIRDRMARLERDARVAGKDAVEARKNGATHTALVLMRKRKLALAESERCASVLVNLDASELALERAEDDVRIAQSYTLVRDALRSTRESYGIDDDGGVNELMMDIREEMDGMDGVGLEAIRPEYAFDEDELNDEFKRLEMECETDRRRLKLKDEAKEKESNFKAPSTIGQRGEVTEPSQSEAVPA